MHARRFVCRAITATTVALLSLSVAVAHAQAPREPAASADRARRAREACDAIASTYGYRIARRDSARTTGTMYELPLHVMHGSGEADVTCRYDAKRDVAELPQWDEGTGQPARVDRNRGDHSTKGTSREEFLARQECKNYINSRPGFRVQRTGTPVARGKHQWDVPLTVRQDDRVDVRALCRYDGSSGTVRLRPR